jgi:prepilin-type N-terminal cleavage/methylation domain-containing protein
MPRLFFQPSRRLGFSLIEVVAAVGIFAIGMVAVIGLFAPAAKSVGNLADSEAATNVASLLASRLQGQPISYVGTLLKVSTSPTRHQLTDTDNNPNAPTADPRADLQLLFASRDGSKIAGYDNPAVWGTTDTEKFFEIALIRNETLSPPTPAADPSSTDLPANPDDTALFLAYTARIRWPAFVPDATPTNPKRALPAGFNPTGGVRYDNSQKQVLFFSGVITR